MFWCFAKVNNRLAEIYFDKEGKEVKFIGHCYVKQEEYTTKREKNWIDRDTKNFQFIYRSKKYKRITPTEKSIVFIN